MVIARRLFGRQGAGPEWPPPRQRSRLAVAGLLAAVFVLGGLILLAVAVSGNRAGGSAAPAAAPTATSSAAPLVPYAAVPGTCVYQLSDTGEAWLWVKSTNPKLCAIMATGSAYGHQGGFITFAPAKSVPAAANEVDVYSQDTPDSKGHYLPHSVTVFTEQGMPGNLGNPALANRAEMVANTLAGDSVASAAPPPHSATSFHDTGNADGDGSFFEVGTGKGNIAAGTWQSTGIPNGKKANGDTCTYIVFSSGTAYNEDITDHQGNGFGAEIANGNNFNPDSDAATAPMTMTVANGNLVLVNGGCTWDRAGS